MLILWNLWIWKIVRRLSGKCFVALESVCITCFCVKVLTHLLYAFYNYHNTNSTVQVRSTSLPYQWNLVMSSLLTTTEHYMDVTSSRVIVSMPLHGLLGIRMKSGEEMNVVLWRRMLSIRLLTR